MLSIEHWYILRETKQPRIWGDGEDTGTLETSERVNIEETSRKAPDRTIDHTPHWPYEPLGHICLSSTTSHATTTSASDFRTYRSMSMSGKCHRKKANPASGRIWILLYLAVKKRGEG